MTAADPAANRPDRRFGLPGRVPMASRRRRFGLALLVPAGALAVAGCGSSSSSKGSSTTTAPAGSTGTGAATTAGSGSSGGSGATATLKIGEIDSLTGTFAQYGVPQHQAIEMAINEINQAGGLKVGSTTYTLKLEALDDKTDAATGALQMQKLLGDNIHFIVGTLSSAVAAAYLPIMKTRPDVIDMVTGAASFGITDNLPVYRPRVEQSQYVPAELNELQTINPTSQGTKVANMYDQGNDGAVQAAPIIASDAKSMGYSINQEPFTAGSAQFGAQISSIKSAGDSVVLFGGNATDEATFIKEARQQGYKGKMISTTGIQASNITSTNIPASDMQGVFDLQAATPTDLQAAGQNISAYTTFAANFHKEFGTPPGFTSASAYDGMYILADALTKAGSITNYSQIHSVLDALSISDVPQLVEAIIPQGPQQLIFKKHQSYFEMAIHTWNGSAFVLNRIIKNNG